MSSIAVIEDEPSTSEIFKRALERDGHKVVAYLTRASAEQGLAGSQFDAVLLDLKMQGDETAGIGIIGKIGRLANPPPVVVISSLDPSFYRPSCLELNVWDFLPKPIEERTLQIKVQRLLEERKQKSSTSEIRSVGELSWDAALPGKFTWKGKTVGVPNISYRIGLRLAMNAGNVQPHRSLYLLFDTPVRVDTPSARANLRAHIKTLRDAFRDIDPDFAAVETSQGGYCWKL